MKFQEGDFYKQTFIVSNKTYLDFIRLSLDQNPLHTDKDFAISKGFEGVVMHGNILNAYLSYFIGECLPTKNVIIHSQEIQFKHPVYMNDDLQFNAEVTGVFDSVSAVEFKFNFKNAAFQTVAKGKIQIGLLK